MFRYHYIDTCPIECCIIQVCSQYVRTKTTLWSLELQKPWIKPWPIEIDYFPDDLPIFMDGDFMTHFSKIVILQMIYRLQMINMIICLLTMVFSDSKLLKTQRGRMMSSGVNIASWAPLQLWFGPLVPQKPIDRQVKYR